MFIIVNIFYIRHLASRDSRRPHNANVCKVSPIRDVPYPKKTDKRIDFAKDASILRIRNAQNRNSEKSKLFIRVYPRLHCRR